MRRTAGACLGDSAGRERDVQLPGVPPLLRGAQRLLQLHEHRLEAPRGSGRGRRESARFFR